MAKKPKVESKASDKTALVWMRIGELEVAYAERTDRVYLRQVMQPIGMRALTAELEGDQPLTSHVAAAAVYALDRAALRTMSALFPKKAKRG
jgi:hypothetical protein